MSGILFNRLQLEDLYDWPRRWHGFYIKEIVTYPPQQSGHLLYSALFTPLTALRPVPEACFQELQHHILSTLRILPELSNYMRDRWHLGSFRVPFSTVNLERLAADLRNVLSWLPRDLFGNSREVVTEYFMRQMHVLLRGGVPEILRVSPDQWSTGWNCMPYPDAICRLRSASLHVSASMEVVHHALSQTMHRIVAFMVDLLLYSLLECFTFHRHPNVIPGNRFLARLPLISSIPPAMQLTTGRPRIQAGGVTDFRSCSRAITMRRSGSVESIRFETNIPKNAGKKQSTGPPTLRPTVSRPVDSTSKGTATTAAATAKVTAESQPTDIDKAETTLRAPLIPCSNDLAIEFPVDIAADSEVSQTHAKESQAVDVDNGEKTLTTPPATLLSTDLVEQELESSKNTATADIESEVANGNCTEQPTFTVISEPMAALQYADLGEKKIDSPATKDIDLVLQVTAKSGPRACTDLDEKKLDGSPSSIDDAPSATDIEILVPIRHNDQPAATLIVEPMAVVQSTNLTEPNLESCNDTATVPIEVPCNAKEQPTVTATRVAETTSHLQSTSLAEKKIESPKDSAIAMPDTEAEPNNVDKGEKSLITPPAILQSTELVEMEVKSLEDAASVASEITVAPQPSDVTNGENTLTAPEILHSTDLTEKQPADPHHHEDVLVDIQVNTPFNDKEDQSTTICTDLTDEQMDDSPYLTTQTEVIATIEVSNGAKDQPTATFTASPIADLQLSDLVGKKIADASHNKDDATPVIEVPKDAKDQPTATFIATSIATLQLSDLVEKQQLDDSPSRSIDTATIEVQAPQRVTNQPTATFFATSIDDLQLSDLVEKQLYGCPPTHDVATIATEIKESQPMDVDLDEKTLIASATLHSTELTEKQFADSPSKDVVLAVQAEVPSNVENQPTVGCPAVVEKQLDDSSRYMETDVIAAVEISDDAKDQPTVTLTASPIAGLQLSDCDLIEKPLAGCSPTPDKDDATVSTEVAESSVLPPLQSTELVEELTSPADTAIADAIEVLVSNDIKDKPTTAFIAVPIADLQSADLAEKQCVDSSPTQDVATIATDVKESQLTNANERVILSKSMTPKSLDNTATGTIEVRVPKDAHDQSTVTYIAVPIDLQSTNLVEKQPADSADYSPAQDIAIIASEFSESPSNNLGLVEKTPMTHLHLSTELDEMESPAPMPFQSSDSFEELNAPEDTVNAAIEADEYEKDEYFEEPEQPSNPDIANTKSEEPKATGSLTAEPAPTASAQSAPNDQAVIDDAGTSTGLFNYDYWSNTWSMPVHPATASRTEHTLRAVNAFRALHSATSNVGEKKGLEEGTTATASVAADNAEVKEKQSCLYFMRGWCKYSDKECKFAHTYRKEVCRDFMRGHCRRGERCWFEHSVPPPPPPKDNDMQHKNCPPIPVPEVALQGTWSSRTYPAGHTSEATNVSNVDDVAAAAYWNWCWSNGYGMDWSNAVDWSDSTWSNGSAWSNASSWTAPSSSTIARAESNTVVAEKVLLPLFDPHLDTSAAVAANQGKPSATDSLVVLGCESRPLAEKQRNSPSPNDSGIDVEEPVSIARNGQPRSSEPLTAASSCLQSAELTPVVVTFPLEVANWNCDPYSSGIVSDQVAASSNVPSASVETPPLNQKAYVQNIPSATSSDYRKVRINSSEKKEKNLTATSSCSSLPRSSYRFKMTLKQPSAVNSVQSSSGNLAMDRRPLVFEDDSECESDDSRDTEEEEGNVTGPLAVDNFQRTSAPDALEFESLEETDEWRPRSEGSFDAGPLGDVDEDARSHVVASAATSNAAAHQPLDERSRWIRPPTLQMGLEARQKRKLTQLRPDDDIPSEKRANTSFSSDSTFIPANKEATSPQWSFGAGPPQPVPPPPARFTSAKDTTPFMSASAARLGRKRKANRISQAVLSELGNNDSENLEDEENIECLMMVRRRRYPAESPMHFEATAEKRLTARAGSQLSVNNILLKVKKEPVERHEDPSDPTLLPPPPTPPSLSGLNMTTLEGATSHSAPFDSSASASECSSISGADNGYCEKRGNAAGHVLVKVKREPMPRREEVDDVIPPHTAAQTTLSPVEVTPSQPCPFDPYASSVPTSQPSEAVPGLNNSTERQSAVSNILLNVKQEPVCHRQELNDYDILPPCGSSTTPPPINAVNTTVLASVETTSGNSSSEVRVTFSRNLLFNVKREPGYGREEPIEIDNGILPRNDSPAPVSAVQSAAPSTVPSSQSSSVSGTVVDPWEKSVQMMSQDEDFPCFYKLWFNDLLARNKRLRTEAGLTVASYIAVDDCHLATNSSAPDEWTNSVRHMMLDAELPCYYKIWFKQLIGQVRQLRSMMQAF